MSLEVVVGYTIANTLHSGQEMHFAARIIRLWPSSTAEERQEVYDIFWNITKTMQTLNPGLYHHHRSWLQGVVKFVPFLMPFSVPDSVFRPHLITQMLLTEVWWLTMGFWNQLSPRAAVTTMLFGKLKSKIFTMPLERVVLEQQRVLRLKRF